MCYYGRVCREYAFFVTDRDLNFVRMLLFVSLLARIVRIHCQREVLKKIDTFELCQTDLSFLITFCSLDYK